MAKTIIKVGGMIVFALFTAITSWPDTNLGIPIEAKFVPFGSFIIFCIFIGWFMIDQQRHINKLEFGRPNMVLGNRTKASLVQNKSVSELEITFQLLYKNIGTKNAYQVHFKVGFAPLDIPKDFMPLKDYDCANPIEPGGDLEHGRNIVMKQKYTKDANGKIIVDVPKNWLIYCEIRYSDSEKDGKYFKDERWFEYKLFGNLSHATTEQKLLLEPYVRDKYSTKI